MIERFAEKHKEATVAIVRSLCNIPAPSFGERKRAEFCKQWLEDAGAEGVYIDSVNNVIYPLCCDGSDEITVVAAHTDTVFPDTACYPEYREDDDCIHCPGAGDDSSGVAVLLMTAKYFMDNKITPRGGILFLLREGRPARGWSPRTRPLGCAWYEGRYSGKARGHGRGSSSSRLPQPGNLALRACELLRVRRAFRFP